MYRTNWSKSYKLPCCKARYRPGLNSTFSCEPIMSALEEWTQTFIRKLIHLYLFVICLSYVSIWWTTVDPNFESWYICLYLSFTQAGCEHLVKKRPRTSAMIQYFVFVFLPIYYIMEVRLTFMIPVFDFGFVCESCLCLCHPWWLNSWGKL